jgi:hypothetical protein
MKSFIPYSKAFLLISGKASAAKQIMATLSVLIPSELTSLLLF